MGINLSDLPPKYRDKIVKQQLQQQAAKYHNVKAERITTAGKTIKFDSQKEARRYDELMLLVRAGQITDLRLQPEFTLQEAYTTPEGVRVRAIKYVADFSYKGTDMQKSMVVEDVKSEATKTRVYTIKRKLMLERYGITIVEI